MSLRFALLALPLSCALLAGCGSSAQEAPARKVPAGANLHVADSRERAQTHRTRAGTPLRGTRMWTQARAGAGATLAVANIDLADPGNGNDIRPPLQAAIDAAADGDTIRLPAGRYLVSGQITIPVNRRLTILGRGIRDDAAGTGTLLYFNQTQSAGSLTMFRANSGSTPTLSDFTIRGAPADFLDNSVGIQFVQAADFRITRMRVEMFGRAGIAIAHSDTAPRGLIDHNSLFHNYKGDGQGLGYGVVIYGQNQQWIPDPRFGSVNFIFVEDNVFDQHRHAIAAGGCGLYVARHNLMKDTFIASAIDAHESSPGVPPGDSNYYSTRAIEAYDNTIVNTISKQLTPITPDTVDQNGSDNTLSQFGIGIRGGEALVHHNSIRGYVYGGAIVDNYYDNRSSKAYPIVAQVGYLSGLSQGASHIGTDAVNGNGDFFYWANRFTPHPFRTVPWWYTGNQPYFYNYTPAAFVAERDFHVSLASDASGVDYSFKPGYRPYTYPHPQATGGVSLVEIGAPVYDISAAVGAEYVWSTTLPSALSEFQFVVTGGSGAVDLYVRRGAVPTTSSYDCRSSNQPNRNPCRWLNAQPGTYYVLVKAVTAVSGVQLSAGAFHSRAGPLPPH